MTAAARVVAVLVGLLLMVLVATALVREVVIAADHTVTWPIVGWWARLAAEPSWTTTGVAALVCAALVVGLLALVVWQGGVAQARPVLVRIETEHGATSLDVPAVERALRHRLEEAVPDIRVRHFELGKGCRVRVDVDVRAADLVGVQARAFAALAPDLERLVGLRLEAVDVVTARLVIPAE
ncbi:MAG TPA: hypothetical protein VFH61_02540 [Thermoleophilia bacterium]|nr:hypothetical protein [Thermoleophilia bacterium]